MNKKAIYFVVFAALLLAAIAAGWMYMRGSIITAPVTTADTPIGKAAETTQAAQSATGDSIEKVNPFKADVNPVSGYKNPFE